MDRVARGYAPVNGAQIYYERRGQGPAVVFIPSGGSDRRMWAGQVADFARHYTTISFDQRGFGRSPRRRGVFRYAGDLIALLEWLGIEHAVLIGRWRAADIALEVVLDRPDLMAALVLVEPSLNGQLPRDVVDPLKQAGRRLLDSGSDPKLARRIFRFIRALLKIRRDLLPKPEPAKTWRRRRAILRSQVISLGNFPHTLAILFSAFTDGARAAEQGINWQQLKNMDPPPPANFERWRRPYVYERLAEVQTPTLIVCSEYLFRAPWRREVIDELSDKLSNAVVARMPGSSGLLQLEYPKLFNVIVLDFLRDRLLFPR